ncbi:hypothetical protein EHH54_05815 [Rhizobium leguminosarum]|uniref:hypothetical protein n=1 Tax=Rhizobium leguminosarum TaxID=384 RepID=UPI000FEC87C4|nr:hypothetical protein [Rhizobium leguminosarum]RWX41664.1 hypothetical protein EHH54_05815 [Rhizobium leguminosarum]
MIAFLLSPVGRWLAGALAAFALLTAAYAYVDHRGYQRAAMAYETQIAELKAAAVTARDAEIERQAAANSAAKTREAERLAEMQAQAEDLQSQIEELQREASEDPDAGRVVLGAPSVQRINKIR